MASRHALLSKMEAAELERLAADWDEQAPEPDRRDKELYAAILEELRYHGTHRFSKYHPDLYGSLPFQARLAKWIGNPCLSEGHQQTLLKAVARIDFIDGEDEVALHRAALRVPITRWLAACRNLNTFSTSFDAALGRALKETWFCPMTDSMNIALFHHINEIAGRGIRPAMRDLYRLVARYCTARKGLAKLLLRHMERNGLRHLVILEDFVGSGTQAAQTLKFLYDYISRTNPVAFVPLIITEGGLARLQGLSDGIRLAVQPVLVVPSNHCLPAEQNSEEADFFAELRGVVRYLHTESVVRSGSGGHGFKGVGTLLVQHTNCPNTTIDLFWRRSPQWMPLFSRVVRESR